MAEVASAYVSLMASARGMGRQIESQVGGEMDQAGASLGSRLGKGIGRAAAGAVATLGAVAAAAGTVGVKTAAQLEQAEIGFTTMLGSGEKAKSFLTDLAGFAEKTPFELPQLQTAASSLVSVGVSADKVIPIMTSLGNATSGMGTGAEGIQRATVALQQMNAAGKITGEDLNQLRDAGIPVYDLLAAATGKSVEAVAELAQKGKLGREELDQLMSALESGKGLERFAGLMEEQSASLVGMWSTLKDTFSMGMADAIQPLVPLIKDGLGGATAFVSSQMPALKSGLLAVTTGAVGLFDLFAKGDYTGKLNDAFGWDESSQAVDALLRVREAVIGLFDLLTSGDFTGNLYSAFGWEESDATVNTILTVRDAVIGLGATVQAFFADPGNRAEIGEQFSSVGASVSALVPVVQEFLTQMPSVTDVMSVAAAGLGFFAEHADLLVKAMPLLVGAVVAYKVAQLASNVAVAASPAIRLLEVAATRAQAAAIRELVVAQRGAAATQVASNVVTTGGVVATNASTAATIRQRIATLASATATKAVAVGTALVTAAQWAWNAAMTANPIGIVVVAIAALVAAFIYAWKNSEKFREIVTGAWEAIKHVFLNFSPVGLLVKHWDAIKAGAETAWNGIVDFFKAVPGRIVGFFLNFTLPGLLIQHWGEIAATATAVWDGIVGFFQSIPDRIASFFLNFTLIGLLVQHWDTIKSTATTVWTSIVDWIKGVPGMLHDAFLNFTLIGLLVSHWDAIKEGATTKFDELVTFVQGIPQRIVDALGNVGDLLKSTGQDLVQGFLNGITDKFSVTGVVDAVRGLVGSAITTAEETLDTGSPSKVFKRLGNYTGEGLALGIEAERRTVERATARLIAIPDAASVNLNRNAVAGAQQAVGTTAPTINATFPNATFTDPGASMEFMDQRLGNLTGRRR